MIVWAKDKYGEIVHAKDAVPGMVYTCLPCGKSCRVRTSSNGMRFFRRDKVAEHTNPLCGDEANGHQIASPEKMRPDTFFAAVFRSCSVKPGKKSTSVRLAEEDNHKKTEENQDTDMQEEQEITVIAPKSLKDLKLYGFQHYNPNTPIGDGYVLSDVVIFHSWWGDTEWNGTGSRVLELYLDRVNYREKTLEFQVKGQKWYHRFQLVFPEQQRDQFWKLVGELTVQEVRDNDTIWRRPVKNLAVLLAGQWERIPDCKNCCLRKRFGRGTCNGCCGTLSRAVFQSARQIYAVGTKKV